MKKEIALFDFDGTITTGDTMKAFFIFLNGKAKWSKSLFYHSPSLLLYLLKLIPAAAAKQKLFQYHLKNRTVKEIDFAAEEFCKTKLPQLLRKKALEKIEALKKDNVEIVIVSASAENWIRPWAANNGIKVIATEVESADGNLTGKFCGKNCTGAEKATRIKEHYNLEDFSRIYAFGDSSGDKEMFQLATDTYFKPFR